MYCYACNLRILERGTYFIKTLFYHERQILNHDQDYVVIHKAAECRRLFDKKYAEAVEWHEYVKKGGSNGFDLKT